MEVVAIATLILREYKISVDTTRFPAVEGESQLQRRERFLKTSRRVTMYPMEAPLIFTRR